MDISPDDQIIPIGGQIQLTLTGSYSDNTTVYLEVNKVSGCFIPDDPSFTIQFHL